MDSSKERVSPPPPAAAGTSTDRSAPIVLALLVLAALGGAALIAYSTARGPGVGGDATIYIASARNLLAGRGLGLLEPDGGFRPLPYFPPFYPLVLALLGLFRIDLVQGARWLNVLLFGGTIFLTGHFTQRFTRSGALAVLASAAIALSPILARVYSWAMSEPLFLFLGFLGLFLSLEYSGAPSRRILLAAALACGLSFLARYVGAAFLGAAGLVVLLLSNGTRAKRWKDAFLFGLVGLAPMGVWVVWDFLMTDTVASRSLGSGFALAERLRSVLPPLRDVGLSWLLPDSWVDAPFYPRALNNMVLAAAVLGFALLVGVVLWRIRAHQFLRDSGWTLRVETRFALGLALLVLVDLLVTLGVYLTTYPPITLDNRMFVQVHVAILLLLVSLLGLLLSLEGSRRWVGLAVWVVLLGVAGSYAWRGMRIAQYTHTGGYGYMMSAWQDSETIRAVRALPPDVPIITNEATAVLFLANRTAYTAQEVYRQAPAQDYTPFGADLSDDAQRVFVQSGGALVLFDTITDQLGGIYGDQTQQRLSAFTRGLYCAWKGNDGAIYYQRAP